MSISRDLCSDLDKIDGVRKVQVSTDYTKHKARHIMIKAKNSILPGWHAGAGKPAWIFVDEVVVN
jgi:hexosaminidase